MSSYALTVQAKAMALAQIGFGARFKTYRLTPMLQVQPGDLPILGVYILREQRREDSQANQGEPAFKHTLTLGFSGGVHVATDKQTDMPPIEEWMSELDDILLCDPSFIALTEGITAMDRIAQFAKVGETTLYEIRVEMAMEFSSRWEPRVPDMLEKVVVTTQFPDKEHVDSGTPQIERVYDIETTP
ncbi:hypothetical protein [Bradyrhizobium japonicum]|uniref:hypothetical protein n=1 Tax=Bradyrhizobium japonicum TaxID=375 RepID=UPI001E5282C0|nr:hypothetical protein [Bradyrhizobium japonicum]MCD9821198.1 hypothetical protein [Bradyrhizobium japonicum]MEB2674106.1 hypothetical protein [Bradyrhizobium japonicum]WRI93293.1 hypothetical protein R3F75_21110 [Bradyrhizobium japonicum]